MTTSSASEDQRALVQLTTPCGQNGSGRLRYSAAMHFNRKGLMSDAALEVYRTCSPYDAEDPAHLLRARGLEREIPAEPHLSGALAIRLLVEEAERYFAGLNGPGVGEMRAGLSRWQSGPVTPARSPANAVIEKWLPVALDQLRQTHPALAQAIELATPHLHWVTFDGYPIDQVGADFAHGHAFASIFGADPGTTIPAADWDMGLFLIPPHVLYRDHKHQAPELYAPLTGPHGWRFGADQPLTILPAHKPVWNDPFVPHLTKVGPTPFLCMYCWTKDVNAGAEIVPASDWMQLEKLRLEA